MGAVWAGSSPFGRCKVEFGRHSGIVAVALAGLFWTACSDSTGLDATLTKAMKDGPEGSPVRMTQIFNVAQ